MKDLAVQLTHHPGALARVASALARRSVNIKALAALTLDGGAVVRILPDDIVAARAALEAGNIHFEEDEVPTVLIDNKAGALAAIADRLGAEGINLKAVYLTGISDDLVEVAFVSDNPKKVKKILEEF
ncbi:MAG: hypothetical protein FIA95_03255 [Gemmatimonadetes bacterium]|nr:hypothetical protein [Gemmatimonadota bacterium]